MRIARTSTALRSGLSPVQHLKLFSLTIVSIMERPRSNYLSRYSCDDNVGMSTLKELDLSRCSKISDAGIKHIASIESLEKLHVSQTGLTDNGVMAISSLINLRLLDLGGVRFTDKALRSLQVCILMVHSHFVSGTKFQHHHMVFIFFLFNLLCSC